MEKDYTIDQVAEIIQVHRKTVEDWILSGELEAYSLKRRKRVTAAALERFREQRKVVPQEQTNREDKPLATVA